MPPLAAGPSGGPQVDHSGPLHPADRRFVGDYLHTVVVVDLPPMAEIVAAVDEDSAEDKGEPLGPGEKPKPSPITSRTLPLLFIRSADGVGYHSGRTVTCENAFQNVDLSNIPGGRPPNVDPGWLAAAQAAAASDGSSGLHGWTLRVM